MISPRGYEIHDWENSKSQFRRFAVLADEVELSGKSLLDVGCGIGDLYQHLIVDRRIDVSYTGVDLLESMIRRARERFPDARFLAADIIGERVFEPGSFDVVFCSGIFNLRIGNHDDFARTMIPVLIHLARSHVVFNMLHIDSPDPDPRYCYFDPDDVVGWEEVCNSKPRVVQGYLSNDFSVVCFI